MAPDVETRPDVLATLCCPTCRSTLHDRGSSGDDVTRLECAGCGALWPVRFGIPDLRPGGIEDPYLSREDDLRAADRLHERALTGGFADALAAYYETNVRVSPAQARRFIAGTLAAEDRSRAVLAEWRASCGVDHGDQGTVVDLGCGTGPLLVAAQAPDLRLIGIDVGLRWLVLAVARLRDRGAHAVLACAGAQRLPLANASADVVASESLIENAPPAAAVVGEAARVLRAGGWLRLTTPNRWSLGPDPHIGIPLGGWLPDGAVAAWARRRGMVPPRRRLLGAGDLRRLVSAPVFENLRVGPPPVTDAQRDSAPGPIRVAVDAYRVVGRSAIGRAALVAIGPSLLGVARRTST